MNGKAVFCFTMAVLCVAGAVGYVNDGMKALRGDSWADAMRYSPNGAEPDGGNVRVVPTNDVKAEAE